MAKMRHIKSTPGFQKIKEHPVITSLSGFVVLLSIFFAIFSELRRPFVDYFYDQTGLDQPVLHIDGLTIDDMGNSLGFHGCPNGYYTQLWNEDYDPEVDSLYNKPITIEMPYQPFIYLSPYHEVRFRVRKNPYSDETLIIKSIYLEITKKTDYQLDGFQVLYDCGAGETEKIFFVDDEVLAAANVRSWVPAMIAPENKESFDYIILNGINPTDVVKIKIPGIIDRIYGFRIRIAYELGNKNGSIATQDIYVGNSKAGQKLWDSEQKSYPYRFPWQ